MHLRRGGVIFKWVIGFLRGNSIAFFALLVSVFAVFISVRQAELTREHNRLSLAPILVFSQESSEGYSLSLLNKGLGPAIVFGLEVSANGEYYRHDKNFDFRRAVHRLIVEKNINLSGKDYSVALFEGFMPIEPGERVDLLKLSSLEKSEEFLELLEFLGVAVCHKSIYNERLFLMSDSFDVPEDSCNYEGSVKSGGRYYRRYGFFDTPIKYSEIFGR